MPGWLIFDESRSARYHQPRFYLVAEEPSLVTWMAMHEQENRWILKATRTVDFNQNGQVADTGDNAWSRNDEMFTSLPKENLFER